VDKFLEPKFVISTVLLGMASVCLFWFPESNQHVVLGVGIVSGVMGYWIGTSISSANKDKVISDKLEKVG
jgi:hypothetical protein